MIHTIAVVWLWIFLALTALGGLRIVYLIGAPRKPYTPADVVASIVMTTLTALSLIALLVGA